MSSDSSGQTVTEGSASVTDGVQVTRKFSYPLLWEAAGVTTGLQMIPAGYSVEIAIPRHSIGWTEAVAAPELSINVRVRRSCGDKPCQAVLESSDDPYNSSPVSDERYRAVSFGRQLPATMGAFRHGLEDEALRPLLFRALLHLDAFDSEGAVAILRGSQDRRLLPVMASALMAAGHFDSAVAVLSTISTGELVDSVRFWATEQTAYSHLLQRASSLAEGEYDRLVSSGRPAFQDIGVAGLIDLDFAHGRADAAVAAYQGAFGGSVSPGMRSASRIADWLQKQGRVQEAIDVLTRLADCGSAHDSGRAWALLQLQSLYQRNGETDKAVATGWRLQALAPPGDPSAEAGLKKLIAIVTLGRITRSAAPPFSDTYRRFREANPAATDPARQIAYAAELRWEGNSDAAAALYEEISRQTDAPKKDRAAALLSLQRLRLESGQVEQSAETGLAIQNSFPRDFGSRLASWQLIRAASAAGGMPGSLRKQVEDFGRALAQDLRSSAQDATDAVRRRVQALSLQLEKEVNLQ